jgi:hypothetical protein
MEHIRINSFAVKAQSKIPEEKMMQICEIISDDNP